MIDLVRMGAGSRTNNRLDPAVIASQVEISWYKNNPRVVMQEWYEYHGDNIDVYFWK